MTALKPTLDVFPDTPMRSAVALRVLASDDPDYATQWLDDVVRGALQRDAAVLATYTGLVRPIAIARELGTERLAKLTEVAQELRRVGALHWLVAATHHITRSLDTPRDTTALVHRDLRGMTLGERRALARRAQGDALQKLLVDPDPTVVAHLLNNPRTTEATVVTIAARRPTVSAALEAVLEHPRWAKRARVLSALAHNPYLFEPATHCLLVAIETKELVAVRNDATRPATLRLAAQRLLDLSR